MGILSALKELSTFVGKAAAGTHYDSREPQSGNLGRLNHIRVRREDSEPSEPVAYRTRARRQATLPPAIDPYTFTSKCANTDGGVMQYECRKNRSPNAAVIKFMRGPENLEPTYGCIAQDLNANPRYIYNEFPREALTQTGYDTYLAAGGAPLRNITDSTANKPSFTQLCNELVQNYQPPTILVPSPYEVTVPVPYEVTVPVPYEVTVPVNVTVPVEVAAPTAVVANPLISGSIGVAAGFMVIPATIGTIGGIYGVCKAYKAIKRHRASHRQVDVEANVGTSGPSRNKHKMRAVRPAPYTIANAAAEL